MCLCDVMFVDLIEDCVYAVLHSVYHGSLDYFMETKFKHPVDANKYEEGLLLLLHSEICWVI